MLVVELNGTGTSLGNGEATGLGLNVLDFVPSLLGHMFCHQRMGGLDGWEFSRHDCFIELLKMHKCQILGLKQLSNESH